MAGSWHKCYVSPVVSSNSITGDNQVLVPVNIRDDGKGNLILVTKRDEVEVTLNNSVGSVDYSKGQVCVGPIAIQGTPDDTTRLPIQVLPYGGSINIPLVLIPHCLMLMSSQSIGKPMTSQSPTSIPTISMGLTTVTQAG